MCRLSEPGSRVAAPVDEQDLGPVDLDPVPAGHLFDRQVDVQLQQSTTQKRAGRSAGLFRSLSLEV